MCVCVWVGHGNVYQGKVVTVSELYDRKTERTRHNKKRSLSSKLAQDEAPKDAAERFCFLMVNKLGWREPAGPLRGVFSGESFFPNEGKVAKHN